MKGTLGLLVLIVIMGAGMNAFGFLGFGGTSWKEEVLLHDGRKIIAERSQSYGGRHEIGQSSPIKEQKITFTLAETKKAITWTSEYSKDIGRANFQLLALHILKGTPYIVASPNLCLSYNKWGRPNPPYVFFKYDGAAWQRIPLEEFPVEFKTTNVTIETKGYEEKLVGQGLVSAEKVRNLNNSLSQPEYQTILRESIPGGGYGRCPKTDYYGKAGWLGIDWFTDQPTYEACLKFCELKRIRPQDCPCETLFMGKK
jgi:hypothetical protein